MAGMNCLSEDMPWTANNPEKMGYIFDTDFLSDAILYVGLKKRKVKVHRFVLQFASPVFYKDFQQVGNNELMIKDVDPEIFIKFLLHLYLGECEASVEECLPLLDIVTKYKVQNLKDYYAEKLNGSISLRNVTTLFQQAIEFGHRQLTEETLSYFCKNAKRLITKDCFLELRQECLFEILKRDDLSVRSELDLFNAVLKWGERECKRQKLDAEMPENLGKVLSKVLALIRFPNMDAEEFTLNVATKSLLGDQELISLLLFFNVSIKNRNKIAQGRFNASSRKYSTIVEEPKVHIVSRNLAAITYTDWTDNHFESLQFKVNKRISLVGLKLFVFPLWIEDVRNDFSGFSCNIVIQSVIRRTFVRKTEIKGFNFFKTIDLESVELEPNCLYQITLSWCGGYTICWDDGEIYEKKYASLVAAKGLQSSCNLEYEGEEGTENIRFQFSRGDSSDWPLDQGIIKELMFEIE